MASEGWIHLKLRGFEIVSAYRDKGITLPMRKTEYSAGYDLALAEDLTILKGDFAMATTGIKAYMQKNEYLGIHIRSSISVKYRLSCLNAQGIIDADYYNNAKNEGHILIPIINFGKEDVFLAKGTRIAQGIFYTYLLTDDDASVQKATRNGGFGSTGE